MSDGIIGKMYDFNSLSVYKNKHLAYEQTQPEPTETLVQPSALVGIEIEVENILYPVILDYYWSGKQDGSLRNHGVEYVSVPLRAYQIPYAMDYLIAQVNELNKPDFSPRTSVHVHLNVRDMTWDQIKVLTLLYSMFEKHFFMFAGTKRETSIFCVPLYTSTQHNILPKIHLGHTHDWHKYNAINLGTILGNTDVPRFGTIEFRHLYGTMDKQTIVSWINSILCLRKATQQYSYDELVQMLPSMNTTSSYLAMYESIFGEYANTKEMSTKDFEYCITQLKHSLYGKTGIDLYPVQDNSKFTGEQQYKKINIKKIKVVADQLIFDEWLDQITPA